MEEIKKLRKSHKELFEDWRAELDSDDQQKLDLHFPQ